MKKTKYILPISLGTLGIIALPLSSFTSCGSKGWVDLTKLNYVPDKKAPISGVYFTTAGLISLYTKAIVDDPKIFEQDIYYSLEKMLYVHFDVRDKYQLKNVHEFKVKVHDINFETIFTPFAKFGDPILYSFDVDYKLDCEYVGPYKDTTKDYHVEAEGSLGIHKFPFYFERDIGDDWFSGSGAERCYSPNKPEEIEVVLYSPILRETTSWTNKWEIVMNEHGVSTQRSNPNLNYDNYVINSKNYLDTTRSNSFFSSLLVRWHNDASPTSDDWWYSTYLNIVSYFLNDIDCIYGVSDGEWKPLLPEQASDDEGEEESSEEGGGDGAIDQAYNKHRASSRVLI